MHVSTAFKWLHRSTTVVLLILVGGYFLQSYIEDNRRDELLVIKNKITNSTTLYVTKYERGGATVSEIYRYYLSDNTQPYEKVIEGNPFLVSDKSDALISGYGNTINVKLTGKIYSFSNLTMFYSQDNLIIPVININATGER